MLSMPVAGECGRGLVAEGLMRPVVVVFVSPVLDEHLGLEEAVEGLEIEQFVSEVAVERFDVGVLPGCAWLDVAGTGAG